MPLTREHFLEILRARPRKEELQKYSNNPDYHQYLREVCLSNDQQINWRAAWLLADLPAKDLQQIFPSAQILIELLATPQKDGYLREIVKIINQLELNEDEEGLFYEAALKLWENLAMASATRIHAIRSLFKIAEVYPELKLELEAYNDDYYFQGLSPGIARQIRKLFAGLS
ncbi:hypothetical protein [Croceimicrobium sp.]|uniref:hypothetical protein n=1 Tax=Croceimicrobium sp. TaxID=2828340 RepID=UPI003BAD6C5D